MPEDILDLVTQRAPEDSFLDFKRSVLDPRRPKEKLDEDRDDLVADLVAFANAHGGHIIVGVEPDAQERAAGLSPMTGDQAKRIADVMRDLAAAHIKPGIVQLEIRSLQMDDAGSEWVVVVAIPDSPDKPHMSCFNSQTRFTLRIGNRKREMAYDEIQRAFLSGPQQRVAERFLAEAEAIKSLINDLRSQLQGAR